MAAHGAVRHLRRGSCGFQRAAAFL